MKKRLLSVGLLLLSFAGYSQIFLDEDFETFTVGAAGPTFANGWTNSGTTTPRWEVEDATGANENSLATGPFFDATSPTVAGGKYLYLETSGGALNDQNTLSSPPVSIPMSATGVKLDFAYHMFGASMGELYVVIDTNNVSDTVVTLIGQQQTSGADPFITSSTILTGYAGKTLTVKFIGKRGTSYTGDISIDEVKLFQPVPNEMGITEITTPTSSCGLTASEVVTIEVQNFGTSNITSFDASFSINGGTPVTETVTTTITPNSIYSYTFTATANLSAFGPYEVKSYVTLLNDPTSSNDTLVKNITNIPIFNGFPYLETFESGPGGWISGGTNSSWALGTPAGTVINSAAGGTNSWVTNLTGTYNATEASYVVSPCFDFTSLVAPVFSADVWWNSEFSWDGAILQTSIDGGTTWQKVGANGDPNNWYTDNTISGLTPLAPSQEGWTGRNSTSNGSGGWVKVKAPLTGLGSVSGVILRIAFGSDGSVMDEGFAFDNIQIYDTPAQDAELLSITSPINGCGLTSTEQAEVQIVNAGSASISNFPVSITVNGGTPLTETVTATILPLDTLFYTFTGTVNLSTTGNYSIKAYTGLTGDGLSSNDTATKVVTHIPIISTFPYSTSFENSNEGWLSSGINNSWSLGVPAGSIIDTASNGTKAWVTNLNGVYNNNEQSFVVSPCLDFTNLTSPLISLDIQYELDNSNDGVVLQSSIDGGATWQKVGAFGSPNNWYTDNTIVGLSSIETSQEGWTGSGTSGSNGWKSARAALSGLGGEPSVILRIALGTNGFTTFEGFAFDNVTIQEAPSTDAGVVDIIDPVSGCGLSSAEVVTVRVVNDGATNISNFPVSVVLNNGTPLTETVTATMLPNDTLTYTFTGTLNMSALGTYSVVSYTSLPLDGFNVNDTASKTVVNIPVISGFPYTESFETSAGGWTVDGGTSSFALGAPIGSLINSASNGTQAWVTNLSGNYLADEAGYVKSPCLDFSTLIAPIISMDVWWNSEFSWDGAVLQSSIDGGTTWQKVGSFGDPNNWYNDNSINGLNTGSPILEPSGEGWTGRNSSSNGSNGWVNATHQLTGLGGQPGVIFRVAFGSDGSVMDEGFAFDNVQIYESPAVDIKAMEVSRPLVGCGLSATETIAARYENLGTDTLTNFPVAYSVNGVAITPETFTDTLFPGDKKSYEFTTTANLANTIQYTIEVWSAAVGDAITSNDTASVTFTNIAASTNPYPQTFDVLTDGATDFSPINWTPINAGAFDWRAETGSTSSGSTGPNAPHNGVGTYIYSEASSGTTGDTIYLESTCIDITPVNGANSSTRVDYWYHMYGQSIIALGLDLDSAGQWVTIDTLLGQKQGAITDTFKLRSLDLSAYQNLGVTTFRFWTIKGASFYGDVAIDDFRVYDTVGVNLAMDSIVSPTSNCGLSASSNVTVKIKNVGLSAISNFPVSYELNGAAAVTETVTATVLPGASLNYTFTSTVNLQTVGSYNLKAYVAVAGDGDVLNDTIVSTINSGFAQPLNQAFPFYYNDFEGATNNWVTYGTNNSWEIGTPSTFFISGPAGGMNAYVTSAASNHNANELSYIETPCFDLSMFNGTDEFEIIFDALFRTESDSDQVWMEMTMDNGLTWSKVAASTIAINFYNNTTDDVWDGFSNAGAGNYIPVFNTITGIGGVSQVKFRFVFKSNGSIENDGFALDNFRINSPLYIGVGKNSLDASSFGLYPNPTREQVTISFNNVATGNYELTIEDVKGQKVVNEVIAVKNSNSTREVNTSQFEKGVYFVRLVNGTSTVTKKLVVN